MNGMNQALLALREVLLPKALTSGVVQGMNAGLVQVATSQGVREYPAAPGVTPAEGQRVILQNNMVTGIVGAQADVPTFYV